MARQDGAPTSRKVPGGTPIRDNRYTTTIPLETLDEYSVLHLTPQMTSLEGWMLLDASEVVWCGRVLSVDVITRLLQDGELRRFSGCHPPHPAHRKQHEGGQAVHGSPTPQALPHAAFSGFLASGWQE
nr:uncharacterized protein LOC133578228 isoform X2 [Nerophis lumbriciformis]